MANFSFTQLRTHQITGTMVDTLEETTGFDQIAASDGHLQKVLDHMASSLKRIHGASSGIGNEDAHLKSAAGDEPYTIRSKGILLSKFANGAALGGLTHDASDNLLLNDLRPPRRCQRSLEVAYFGDVLLPLQQPNLRNH